MKRLIGVVLFVSLGLVSCGGNNATSESDSIQESTSETDVLNMPSSEDVVATTLTGDAFSLQEALKDKPVVLWFWAPG